MCDYFAGELLAQADARVQRFLLLTALLPQVSARAAAAHTASVAGDQRIFRALVEEAGGAWASDPHELLELAKALAEPRARPAGRRGR